MDCKGCRKEFTPPPSRTKPRSWCDACVNMPLYKRYPHLRARREAYRKWRLANDPEYADRQRIRHNEGAARRYVRARIAEGLRPYARRRQENGLLECTNCTKMLPLGWYARNGTRSDGSIRWASWCRDCMRGPRAVQAAKRRGAGVVSQSHLPKDLVRRLITRQYGACACGCGRSLVVSGFHVDHWNPITNGGRHEEANLRLLTPRCNLAKGKKLPRGVAPMRLSSYRPMRQGK